MEISLGSFQGIRKNNTPEGAFKPKLYFCICDYIDWIQEQATDCHKKVRWFLSHSKRLQYTLSANEPALGNKLLKYCPVSNSS